MKFKLAEMLEKRATRRFMDRMSGDAGVKGLQVVRPGIGDVTRLLAVQSESRALDTRPVDPRTPTALQ